MFVGCQDENDIVTGNGNENLREIQFSASTSPTDVMTRAWGSSFENGDKIGIYVVRHLPNTSPVLQSSGNYADNKCYKISTNGRLLADTEKDKVYASTEGYVYSIYAYYPYQEGIIDPMNISFNVAVDQSRLEYVKKSDLMLTQVLNFDINSPVMLNFKRKMTFLNVAYNEKPDGIVPIIAVHGMFYKCKVNLATGTLEKVENQDLIVSPMCQYGQNPGEYYYCMILPSFNFQDYVSLQVNLDGKLEYYWKDSGFPLQEGGRNDLYLTIDMRRVTYTAVSDEGIGGTIVGSGNVEVVNGRQFTVSAMVYDGYIFGGWYKNNILVSENLDYTFVVREDIHLEARFQRKLVTINIVCSPSKEVLAPYYDIPSMITRIYGDQITLYGFILSDSPYLFVGWYEDGNYLNRDYVYTFPATIDRTLLAKYCLRMYSLGSSSGYFIMNQPGYFTRTFADKNNHQTYLQAGQKIQQISECSYQEDIAEHISPISIIEKKLTIKLGEQIIKEANDFENLVFTAPQNGIYTFNYSMTISGTFKQGEKTAGDLYIQRTAWYLDE